MLDSKVERQLTSNRLDQAAPFLAICSVGWLAYAIYSAATGRMNTAILCGIESVISAACLPLLSNTNRGFVIRIYLVAAAAGVFLESVTSGLALSDSPIFLSCIVLAAVHLLGPQSAIKWTLIAVTGLWLIHFGIQPSSVPVWRHPTQQDRVIAQMVLSMMILCLALMTEKSIRKHAYSMEVVSDALRIRTEELGQLASFDPLTGLANRNGLNKRIEKAIERAKAKNAHVGVLVVDLNGFKQINDTMGHASGDTVLKVVAERLRDAVDLPNAIIRVGGDEFVVVIEQPINELEVILAAGRIVRSVARPYSLEGSQLDLGASVGAAIYPTHSESVDELLSFADAAMYDAKVRRLGVQSYEARMTTELSQRRKIDQQLKAALPNEEFELFYQPQVCLPTGRISAVEALIRWRQGSDCILPSKFVPQLESSRFIVEVGRWVLREACQQARLWQQQGIEMCMSVNVSAIQFQHGGFMDDVLEALEVNSLSPDKLDIELTESVLIGDHERTINTVNLLRECGVSISVDDFGTGYSSLAYLKSLPINRLKIDRQFIKDIPEEDDGMIAATIVSLAHNLGMSVIAEGVSSELQLRFLEEQGCDEYQGYLFSKPLQLGDCDRLFAQHFTESSLAEQLNKAAVESANVTKTT